MSTPPLRLIPLLLALALLIVIPPDIARAQTITLTDPNCTRDGLNAAIQAAPDGATITFSCADPVIEFTEQIVIQKDLTIDGGGTIVLDALEGDGIDTRFLEVAITGNTTLAGLTLGNGFLEGNAGSGSTVTGAVGGAILNQGTLNVENSSFNNNTAVLGGAIYSRGDLIITDVLFTGNTASASGGAIYSSFGVVQISSGVFRGNSEGAVDLQAQANEAIISGSLFENNTSTGGSFTGAAITNNTGITGSLTITDTTFIGNTAPFGFEGAIYNFGTLDINRSRFFDNTPSAIFGIAPDFGTLNIRNTCFVNNEAAVIDLVAQAILPPGTNNLNNNYWGAPDGPNAPGVNGSGDAITGGALDPSTYSNFLRPPLIDLECPTLIPDFYTANFGETLSIAADEGVVSNDLQVQRTTVELDTAPDFGSLDLRADGSFDYTPDADTTSQPVDGFRYSVLENSGFRVTGLVCITRSTLNIITPPTQTTTLGTPIVISPPVTVTDSGSATSTQVVRVELNAKLGLLSVPGGNTGTVGGITPSVECKNLLDALRTASVPDAPSVVQGGSSIEMMNGNVPASRRFTPYYQTSAVSVQGSGTRTLVLEGPIDQVNTVLQGLTYTPQNAGIDNVDIIANDAGGGVAVGQVIIIVGGGSIPGGGGGGSDSPSVLTSDGDTDNAAPSLPAVPLGPSTLFEISRQPNTVIIGENDENTVAGGDVFVEIIATNGTLRVSPERIGDPQLLQLPFTNGAEVFGLQFDDGSAVTAFATLARICLKGPGTFYYRDATDMPRITVILPSTFENGFTCANIPNAGTIILVQDGSIGSELAPDTALFVPESGTLPEGCMVTTDAIINLREGPGTGNEIIRRIPFDVTLTAFEQSGRWYYVDYLGLQGWMSADFVSPNEMC